MPVPPTGGDAGATAGDGTASASGAGATTAQTSGADTGTDGGPATGPDPDDSTGPGVVDTDSGIATDSGGTQGSGSGGTTSRGGTDSGGVVGSTGGSTGGDPVTLGFACTMDSDCDQAAGEECCGASQCADTCMIPCGGPTDCPVGMGCAHNYCLFECANNDADCAMWPGYTCQHPQDDMNTLCEAD